MTDQLLRNDEKRIAIIEGANSIFEARKTVVEAYEFLTQIPRPILVDFNGVIASDEDPLILNNYALEFLAELKAIGTVVIVTTTPKWGFVHDFLVANHIWSNDIVLITGSAYNPEDLEPEFDPLANQIFQNYDDVARSCNLYQGLGENDTPAPNNFRPFWKIAEAYKRLVPFFKNAHLVPLIDNNVRATMNNPGIKGICVPTYPEQSNRGELPVLPEDDLTTQNYHSANTYHEKYLFTLKAAVEIVRNLYSTIK